MRTLVRPPLNNIEIRVLKAYLHYSRVNPPEKPLSYDYLAERADIKIIVLPDYLRNLRDRGLIPAEELSYAET